MKTAKKFDTGSIAVTPSVLDAIGPEAIIPIINRHVTGDWGDVSSEDKRRNDWSLENDERLVSAYMVGDTKVLIITERDRSVTTVLLPEDY